MLQETEGAVRADYRSDTVDPAVVSPMMRHYLSTKKEYPGCILFYRLGDFYEMFFEDALTVSRELELTLTGKSCGLEERAPMCGVPFHAADSYITRLVEKGYKVAVCEQVEDPKTAKGIVKREVTRIVTPGTNTDMASLREGANNYIVCIQYGTRNSGLAACDVTTGDFFVTQLDSMQKITDEILRLAPSEILCDDALMISGFTTQEALRTLSAKPAPLDARYFDTKQALRVLLKHFRVLAPSALGLEDMPAATCAAGALLSYLYETQKNDLTQITRIETYASGGAMLLGASTRRSLELTETIRDKEKKGSLLWVLDRTKTAMGARCLRSWIERPLLDRDRIEARLDAVEELLSHAVDREEIREYLRSVYDLERLLTKIAYLSANPRDLIALGASMRMLAPVRMILSGFGSSLLKELFDEIDPLEDLVELVERSISEDAPITVREGGIIREGYDADIDHLRLARTQGKEWLLSLEEEDRQRTGIRNLKIKYNKVFGYYFDVTNSYRDLVPPDYERKQTLVGSERYTTPRLRELEDSILNAQDKLNTLEYDAFCGVRDAIAAKTAVIQRSAKALAALDTLCSFAAAAEENRYVRPSFNDKDYLRIRDGRHPVVEKMLSGDFIANDTYLDSKKDVIAIITGPNMAGKSTYMRQVALICLMAQTGCFVPASSADLCIVDRIFTRVGASDDLGSGQSTFMVEMNEVANILRNATPRSLLILDEIGRGTSTFDGLSIAWAVIEHISNKRYLGAKTLFATHYHELTELEGKIDNVKNYCVAVREKGDDIIFLRKIVAGGADHSYGIQVARLAGVPEIVTDRAMEIAAQLTDNDITEKMAQIGPAAGAAEKKTGGKQHYDEVDLSQMSFLSTVSEDEIIRQIKEADIPSMTPMDALNLLYRLQNDLSNTWG